jgi:hypothetical protein
MEDLVSDVRMVAPEQIEKELNTIWEALSAPKQDPKSRRMRACLFNLILVTDKNPRATYIRGIAERIIEKFPSRILFITIDRENKEDILRTGVSVLSPGGDMGALESDIACDFIEFTVTGTSLGRIPFVLLPHLLPDLPVYLLWAEDPVLDNPLAYQLEKFSSRLIFDSETTANLPLFAKALLHHQEVSKADIADLNWARTESWRTLLRATFHSQERLAELEDTRLIKLVYNVKPTDFFCHTRIQSIYVQGWLSIRLGWELKEFDASSQTLIFHYEGKNRQPIEVQLVPEEHPEFAPGAISTFELTTYSSQHFLFVRNPQASYQVTLFICSKEKCEMPTQFLFSKGGIGQTLVKEICQKSTSEHYLKLLSYLSGLEALSLC